jgi:phosphomannomutase
MINANTDPYFGATLPCPYPRYLTDMARTVVSKKYTFGFALDGDGDRIAVIDERGKFHDCNYLAAAFYYYLTQIKKQNGGAVKSFLTSNLLVKVCKKYETDVHETAVGFKYLGPALESTNSVLAAEGGGIAFKQVSLIKDGITAAALLVDMVATMKKGISEIIRKITADVNFPSAFVEFAYTFNPMIREAMLEKLLSPTKPEFADTVKIDNFPDGYKIRFKNDYWCAARISGTESALRFYTEMPDAKHAMEIIETLERFYDLGENERQI